MISLAAIRAEREARQKRPIGPLALAVKHSQGRYKEARHLRLLDEKLRAVADGRLKRLIVTMPPRHGKSELCSRYFPAWYLGTYPDRKIILTSYEADFASEWGAKARDVLEESGGLFGVAVSPEARARNSWNIDGHDGGMKTAGVGGPITGKGCNVLIVDDPVKNAAEANSPTYRESTWSWWTSTAVTRIEPEGGAVVIQTRWHEDDLAGRLIAQNDDPEVSDEERWEVLNLPAIAETDDAIGRLPGEALWPERWNLDRLKARMKAVGSIVWNALFQQRPTAPEGNYFKRQWFKIIEPDRVPAPTGVIRNWDLAATIEGEKGNTDPDYLSGCKMSRGVDGKYYVHDMIHERVGPEGVQRLIKQAAALDGRYARIKIEQEGAASGKIVAYEYTRMMDGYDCRFESVARASKYTRSGPFNAACERGDVLLIAGPWNQAFLDEITQFPAGKHDDQVDAAVGAYNDLSGGGSPWTQSQMDHLEAAEPIDLDKEIAETW